LIFVGINWPNFVQYAQWRQYFS